MHTQAHARTRFIAEMQIQSKLAEINATPYTSRWKALWGMINALPFVLSPDVVFLREVNEVNHRFGRQKQVFVQHFDL